MALGAENHPLLRTLPRLRLTPELFGKLFVLAWAESHGRSDLADRDRIISAFLSGADDAPSAVRDVMHLEDRITGPSIAEYTDYMVAAQDDGLLKRWNPAHVRCYVEVAEDEAEAMLADYENEFADVVSWLRKRVKEIAHE